MNVRRQRDFLLIETAGQACALEVCEVREVVAMVSLSRPPLCPSILAGFLNLGGEVISVVRLARLLGRDDPPLQLFTPIVVLRNPDWRLALLVGSVQRIISVDESSIISLTEKHLAQEALTVNEEVVGILSPPRLLLVQEQRRLAELREMEQRRLAELQEASA